THNGLETFTDCGGPCAPCGNGQPCLVGSDCESDVCHFGVCAPAACNDGVRNGDELDVDCGGGCGLCPGEATIDPFVCASLVAVDGRCVAPACDDGVLNGDETSVDCGGSCG